MKPPRSKRTIDPDKVAIWIVYHRDFMAPHFNTLANPADKARAKADLTALRAELEDLISQNPHQPPQKVQPVDTGAQSLYPGQLELVANGHFVGLVKALPIVAAVRLKQPHDGDRSKFGLGQN